MQINSAEPDQITRDVWVLSGGFPLRMNVYYVREGQGVAVFDSGIASMGPKIQRAAEALGGPTRVIIGNAHADHRGGAKAIDAPLHCHADERADVEGDGGASYFDYGRLPFPANRLTPRMFSSWDSGPLKVEATLSEGDRVGEFAVVHLPGHSPGCIGLWREQDRLAISNDCFALFDPTLPLPGRPRVPHPAFNWSTERARESIAKLAALDPRVCLPGHFGPLDGDVKAKLRSALSL